MDAKKCAMLIMHCQNDIVDEKGAYSNGGSFKTVKEEKILEKIAETKAAVKAAGMQVIYINNKFSPDYRELGERNLPLCSAARDSKSFMIGTWGVDNPEIIKIEEDDYEIINYSDSCFVGTTLEIVLLNKGITDLYLCGVATNFVVESCAREASHLNFNCHVLEDCCASWAPHMHEFAIKETLPQFAEITNHVALMDAVKA